MALPIKSGSTWGSDQLWRDKMTQFDRNQSFTTSRRHAVLLWLSVSRVTELPSFPAPHWKSVAWTWAPPTMQWFQRICWTEGRQLKRGESPKSSHSDIYYNFKLMIRLVAAEKSKSVSSFLSIHNMRSLFFSAHKLEDLAMTAPRLPSQAGEAGLVGDGALVDDVDGNLLQQQQPVNAPAEPWLACNQPHLAGCSAVSP